MQAKPHNDRFALALSLVGILALFTLGKISGVVIVSWWWSIAPILFFVLIYTFNAFVSCN